MTAAADCLHFRRQERQSLLGFSGLPLLFGRGFVIVITLGPCHRLSASFQGDDYAIFLTHPNVSSILPYWIPVSVS